MSEPLFVRVKKVCPTTTETAIDSPVVPPGEFWELTFVAAYNDSAENFKVSIGVLHANKHLSFSLTATLATKAAVIPTTLPILGEGEKLQVLGTGSSAGGDIWLILSGWRHKLAEVTR